MAFWRSMWRVARNFGIVGFSPKNNVLGMNPLIISTFFMALTALLASALRKMAKSYLQDGLMKQMSLEFVATAELCAICYELIIVADNYGVWMYALFLFMLSLWWSRVWEVESACPYAEIEKVIEGSQGIKNAVLVIVAQLIGGLVIYQYVALLWSLELTENHKGRAEADCTTDLQVSAVLGTFVEGLATCVCRLASRFLSDAQAQFAHIVDPFFATMMVVAAFNYSGGYFNPALATSLKIGCEGASMMEFMAVYWLGACAGSILSVLIYNTNVFKKLVDRVKPKVE